MKEFPHQTTADVTAAILLAIRGLEVSSGTSENGMCAKTTGCFNIGHCFLFSHLHLVLRFKVTSCVSTAHMPSWHAQEQLYACLPFPLFFNS